MNPFPRISRIWCVGEGYNMACADAEKPPSRGGFSPMLRVSCGRTYLRRMVTIVGEVEVSQPSDEAKPGAGATALNL